ncbi:MATE family efflux transporter [Candidatus Accumulibacter sp. ACC003]|jgi:O-antigen/teichoic acid export membrane protein|uniref:lipopolysaccharide biosynthesis protein n=1 Tax=Candidatus Accumulibacter sp. ACC003 TaxID=2823334 RepID=UPI0025B90D03|nr:MATE family efflux transporter [Candidatus Accumulibacter sp. ACC003]
MFAVFSRYKHINWALADQTMVSGVNFLTGILLARFLGLDEYGRFALAWMVVLFCSSIQQAAIIAPMMSFGATRKVRGKPAYYAVVAAQELLFSLLCSALLGLATILSAYFAPDLGLQDLVWPLSAALFAFQLQDFLRRYFFSRNFGRLAFFNDAISYLGQVSLLVPLFYFWQLNSALVLWIIAATSGAAVVVGIWSMDLQTFSGKRLRRVAAIHLSHSKWLVASALSQWTSGNFFIVTLGATLGSEAVGAIRAVQNVLGVTHVIFMGMENIIPASVAKCLKSGGVSAVKAYIARATWFCMGGTAFYCLIVAVNPEAVLRFLFGQTYSGYGYLLWWYVPVYLLMSVGLPLRSGLRAFNDVRPIFSANLLASVLAIAAASWFIEQWGVKGAIAGLISTQIVIQGYTYNALRKRLII